MAPLEVKVLGPLFAARGGEALPLGGSKPRLALALLAARAGRNVSLEELIDGLWGEDPPPTARKSVQVHISALRKVLHESAISTTDGGYTLQAAVDAAQVEELVAEAARVLPLDASSALSLAERAISLWRGEPYADLADEEALRGERTRLADIYLRAQQLRIEALLDLGRHQEAAGDLEALTMAHPYREELRAMQMIALYRSGRQVDALRAFQDARRILGDDLGVEPSAELAALEQRILDHDPGLEGPKRPRRPETLSTLPAHQSDLIGRSHDVEVVGSLLASARLVTITGVGGAGKTSLAVEAAHGLIPSYPGGVFFVDLTTISDDGDVLAATMEGMGLPVVGIEPSLDRIMDFLRTRSCLLVIDNCEHVLDGAARLASYLLNRCGDLAVLATSREALSIPGEHVYRIPLLDADRPGSPAVELFLRRAKEADFDFALTDEEGHLVVEICQSLDGIPLAIELAASQTRSLSIAEIKERLDDRFTLLTGGSRNPRLHHQTLLATVGWSYSLLDPSERTMLRKLSVFNGGFDIADVPAVSGIEEPEASQLVDALVSKSLVSVIRDGASIRRRLLETIRLFGLERLTEAGEEEDTRRRHYEQFVGALKGTSFNLNNHVAERYHRNERELSNIVAAIEWGIENGETAEAALTVARVFWPMINRGILHKYEGLLDGDYDLTPEETALLLVGRIMMAYSIGDPVSAQKVSADAIALDPNAELDDGFLPRTGAYGFAPVEGAAERLATLDDLLEKAARSATPDANVAMVEMHRAGQLYSLGRIEDALEPARRASRLARTGGLVFWDEVLAEIGLLILLGRRDEARSVLDDLETMLVGESDLGRGVCAVGAGDPRAAAAALVESARRHVTGRIYLQEGDYLCLFAAHRKEIGDFERADALLRSIQLRFGVIQWLVWPYVWDWTEEDFVAMNTEARHRELARMTDPNWDPMVMARLLNEEIAFWDS